MAPSILCKIEDGIATVILNRPDVHNAFDERMIAELTADLEKLGASDKVRAVVLRGEGKSFCAGGDLNWMKKSAGFSRDENVADAMRLGQLLKTLNTLPKVTIALVHGAVYGGGVGLTACCDIAIASEVTKFCLSEVKVGLIPSVIAPYVIAAMGQRQARRYFLTAEPFSAETAYRIGFIHAVAPKGDVDLMRDKVLAALAEGAPTAQVRGKKLILDIAQKPIDDAIITLTSEAIADARAAPEGKEGLSAFLEKREPAWKIKKETA